MRFPPVRALALLLSLLFLFSACSPDDGTNQVIKYDIEEGILNLDPQFATDETARMIISNSFEGLFRQHPDGKLEPGLVSHYEISPDGLTYTFTLRQDAYWSAPSSKEEPRPVTAHDFDFALSRLFNPDAPSPFAASLRSIAGSEGVLARTLPASSLGVTAEDTYTLRITLSRRETALPELLASSYAMPCNEAFFADTKGRYGLYESGGTTLIYNGPFRISRWDNELGISLRRNTVYHGTVLSRGVEFNIPSAIARTAESNFVADPVERFLAKTTDACKIDASLVSRVLHDGGSVTEFEDTVWVLALNTKAEKFSSPDMRQAVAYSVDRSLFDTSLPDHFRATNTLIPPALTINARSFRESVGNSSPLAYSPDLASRSYKKAMEDLSGFSFGQILIYDDPDQARLTGYLQRTLQKGVASPVGITRLTGKELMERVKSGDFTAAIIPLAPEYSSPDAVLNLFRTDDPGNFTGFSNAQFDELMQKSSTLSAKDQMELYSQAEQLLLTQCPVIPLYYETSYFGAAPGVSGIEFAPFLSGIRFADALKVTS